MATASIKAHPSTTHDGVPPGRINKQPADPKDAAVHNWPDGPLTESRWGLWAARGACLFLMAFMVAAIAFMSRGAWPSDELKARCSDANNHSKACNDVEGQSSARLNGR